MIPSNIFELKLIIVNNYIFVDGNGFLVHQFAEKKKFTILGETAFQRPNYHLVSSLTLKTSLQGQGITNMKICQWMPLTSDKCAIFLKMLDNSFRVIVFDKTARLIQRYRDSPLSPITRIQTRLSPLDFIEY